MHCVGFFGHTKQQMVKNLKFKSLTQSPYLYCIIYSGQKNWEDLLRDSAKVNEIRKYTTFCCIQRDAAASITFAAARILQEFFGGRKNVKQC